MSGLTLSGGSEHTPANMHHPVQPIGPERIIHTLADQLTHIVSKTLTDSSASPEKRIEAAVNLIRSSSDTPFEVRRVAMQHLKRFVDETGAAHKDADELAGQLAFDMLIKTHEERVYSALEELADQTVGLAAGSGEIYLDHLLEMAKAIQMLEQAHKTPGNFDKKEAKKTLKHLKEEFEDEASDLLKAIKPEVDRAKKNYDEARMKWQKASESTDPAVVFAAFTHLEEAQYHLQKIGEQHNRALQLGEIGTKFRQMLPVIATLDKTHIPELVQSLDQMQPEQITHYVQGRIDHYGENESFDEKAYVAFKREMRPFFEAKPPMLKAQKEAFLEAKKELAKQFAEYEGTKEAVFEYSAKFCREMRASYLLDQMDQKKYKELTIFDETETKTSKIGIFFLALQALTMLRGAASLVSGQDFKEMKTKAQELHRQALDNIDPEIRKSIQDDASRMGTFLHDKWKVMKENESARKTFLEKLSPIAQDAVKVLLAADIAPTSIHIQTACDAVIAKGLASKIASPFSHMSISEWIATFMGPETEAEQALVGRITAPVQPDSVQQVFQKMIHKISVTESFLAEYGNKHKRLVELHELVDSLGMKGVVVPLPFGIKSRAVHEFIAKKSPQVLENWKKLGELYAARPQGVEGKAFLDRDDVANLIKDIWQLVMDAFRYDTTILQGSGIEEWLQPIRDRGSYLMVRSTGDEDSSYANAGGNVSESYVPTTTEEILKAAGKVIASYFSIPSLTNRLNAGQNPFEKELKLAVTMQELIGEVPDDRAKDVPVSLVLFTNEPNFGGNERFRIMRLSATHGHGEAVVGNKGIATDSFFLLQSKVDPDDIYIISDVKEKPQRLAPVRDTSGVVRLEMQKNPEKLITTPSLDKEMLIRLFELGKQVEARYADSPTDMEIVVKGTTIYPVQARPVNRPIPKPSYIDLSKVAALSKNPIVKELRGTAQVVGTADAIIVRDQNQILIATTLEEAERNFRLGQHRFVVFKEPEPVDSHYIVNFAGMGISCIQMDDIDTVKEAVKFGTIVADIQDGSIKLWDDNSATAESCISKGYLSHPAHVTISLDSTNFSGFGATNALTDLREIIRQVKIATTQKLAHEHIEAYCARPELAHIGKESSRLLEEMQRLNITSLRGHIALKAGSELDARIRKACAEAIPLSTERLETLFHAKVLETLTFQAPKDDGSLGKLSLVTLPKLLHETEQIINYAQSLGTKARFADLVVDAQDAPLSKTKELWIHALKILETSSQELQPKIEMLLELVDVLRASNGLGPYLTFALGSDVTDNPEALLDQLLVGQSPYLLETMQKFQKDAVTIREMRQQLPQFADPANFWQSFECLSAFIHQYKSPEGIQDLKALSKSDSLAAKLLVADRLAQVVTLFDASIKSMLASTLHTVDQKLEYLKVMVREYMELFQLWVEGLGGLQGRTGYFTFMNVHANRILNQKHGQETLKSSSTFSMFYSMYISNSRFITERGLPNTVGDLFTLTHQNLLSFIELLANNAAKQDLLLPLLPEKMKMAIGSVVNQQWFGYEAQYMGTQITEDRVAISYNIRLRDHSLPVTIKYDTKSGAVSAACTFVGDNEKFRWQLIQETLHAFELVGVITLVHPPAFSPMSLSCEFSLSEQNSSELGNMLHGLADFSMDAHEAGMGTRPNLFNHLYTEMTKHPDLEALLALGGSKTASAFFLAWNQAYHPRLQELRAPDDFDKKVLSSVLKSASLIHFYDNTQFLDRITQSECMNDPDIRRAYIEGYQEKSAPVELRRLALKYPESLPEISKALLVHAERDPEKVHLSLQYEMKDMFLQTEAGREMLTDLAMKLTEKGVFCFQTLVEGPIREELQKTEKGKEKLVLFAVNGFPDFRESLLINFIKDPSMRAIFVKNIHKLLEKGMHDERIFKRFNDLLSFSGIVFEEVTGFLQDNLNKPMSSPHFSLLLCYLGNRVQGASLVDAILTTLRTHLNAEIRSKLIWSLHASNTLNKYSGKVLELAVQFVNTNQYESAAELFERLIERKLELPQISKILSTLALPETTKANLVQAINSLEEEVD